MKLPKRFQSHVWFPIVFLISLIAFEAALGESKEGAQSDPFSAERLLNVEIQMDPDEWHELRITHRTVDDDFSQITENPYKYYSAEVVIDGQRVRSVGVRKKGFFGSVVSTRPSLKIRFNKFEKGQRFFGLDMLTLNNNVQDATHAHQYMAYSFFNRAGVIAPRCNLARVTVNGEDLGIYSNVESIRKPFLKRSFKESNGQLFEGYAGDFRDDDFDRIVEKSGVRPTGREHLERLKELLSDSEPVSVSEVNELVNLEAFIRLWAAEVLIAHWDGYSGNRNNYYLYLAPSSDRLFFIPWGADAVFFDPGPFIVQPVPKSVKAMGVLCKRLWEIPEIRKRYRQEMQRLLDDVWDEEAIREQLEWIHEQIDPYVVVDRTRLKFSSDMIRAFLKNRRGEVQAELNAPPVDWPGVEPMKPPQGESTPMKLTGSFTVVRDDAAPADPLDAGEASLNVFINDQKKDYFTRFGAFVEWPNKNVMIPRPGYPVVYLHASDRSGERRWLLSFLIDPVRLSAAAGSVMLPVDYFAVMVGIVEGDPMSPTAKHLMFGIQGDLKLEQTGQGIGGKLVGEFTLRAPEF